MATVDGDPNILVRINNSSGGAGSTFIVRDQSAVANMLKVEADSKLVTLYGDLERAAPLALDNVDGGAGTTLAIMRRSGTDRLTFGAVSANTFAEVKASTSGWDLRLSGNAVHVNTTQSTGTIAQFSTVGTPRLSVSWDGTDVTLTAPTSGADLHVSADEVHINTVDGTGTIAHFSTNGTSRLEVSWDGTEVELAGATDVTIHFGSSTAVNSKFKLRRTTGASAERDVVEVEENGIFELNNGDNGVTEARLDPNDSNVDCYLELGIDDATRGKIRLNRAQGGSPRPGTLVFQDQDGNNHYLWVYDTNAGAKPYELRTSTADPGSGAGGTTLLSWA